MLTIPIQITVNTAVFCLCQSHASYSIMKHLTMSFVFVWHDEQKIQCVCPPITRDHSSAYPQGASRCSAPLTLFLTASLAKTQVMLRDGVLTASLACAAGEWVGGRRDSLSHNVDIVARFDVVHPHTIKTNHFTDGYVRRFNGLRTCVRQHMHLWVVLRVCLFKKTLCCQRLSHGY